MENWINIFKAFGDFVFGFGTGEDDLSIDEDKENDARLHHAIDETGKEFGLVRRKLPVHLVEILETNWKAEIDGGHKILNLKVDEFHIVTKLLNDASELSCSQMSVVFIAGTSAHQFA
jgi:hypothetical protein